MARLIPPQPKNPALAAPIGGTGKPEVRESDRLAGAQPKSPERSASPGGTARPANQGSSTMPAQQQKGGPGASYRGQTSERLQAAGSNRLIPQQEKTNAARASYRAQPVQVQEAPLLAERKQRGPNVQFSGRQSQKWKVDGWRAIYDSRSKMAEREGDAPLYFNLMPVDPDRGGPLYVRPGKECVLATATAPRIGNVSFVQQGIFPMVPLTGVDPVMVIADGEIWTISSSGVATKRVTAANITTAGVTLSPAGTGVMAVQFNGKMVIAQFGSRPFTWNGTAGAGGLVNLTNAPASVISATVYYGKLFFLGTDNVTIYWSEENQENLGYGTAPYNNAWALTQTSSAWINGILGTNEGLYYFRSDSVGVIRGAVTSTFQTDGVHDSVHQGSGADSGGIRINRVARVADSIFWFDNRGQVFGYRPGGGAVNLTDQLPRLYGLPNFTNQPNNTASVPVYGIGEDDLAGALPDQLIADPFNGRILVEYIGTGGRFVFVYDALSYSLLSIWDMGTLNTQTTNVSRAFAAVAEVASSAYYLFVDPSGYVFSQRLAMRSPALMVTYDQTEAGTKTAVVGTVLGPMHGHTAGIEWQFTQLDVLTDPSVGVNQVTTVGYITSRFHKQSLTPSNQVLTETVADAPHEHREAFGLNTNGRWCRPIIKITGNTSSASAASPPALMGYELTGVPVSTSPAVT